MALNNHHEVKKTTFANLYLFSTFKYQNFVFIDTKLPFKLVINYKTLIATNGFYLLIFNRYHFEHFRNRKF